MLEKNENLLLGTNDTRVTTDIETEQDTGDSCETANDLRKSETRRNS